MKASIIKMKNINIFKEKTISTNNKLNLQYFITRQQILQLYKQFFRLSKSINDKYLINEIRSQIRMEFKKYGNITNASSMNPVLLKSLLVDGQKSLKQLEKMCVDKSNTSKSNSSSWMDINDPDDKRGRVGTGWPWNR